MGGGLYPPFLVLKTLPEKVAYPIHLVYAVIESVLYPPDTAMYHASVPNTAEKHLNHTEA